MSPSRRSSFCQLMAVRRPVEGGAYGPQGPTCPLSNRGPCLSAPRSPIRPIDGHSPCASGTIWDTRVRESKAPPRFTVDDPVLTTVDHRAGHTRLPRYARGRRGVVAAQRGGEHPQHLYSVRCAGLCAR